MNFHFLPRSNGLFWKKCRGWFFFRKIGFLPFFTNICEKDPLGDFSFGSNCCSWIVRHETYSKSPGSSKSEKIWLRNSKKCGRDWKSWKNSKICQKKDTAKIGPKSKKQKHRKLPTDEYYGRMKSFFQNIEPNLSVFFLTCHFWDFLYFRVSRTGYVTIGNLSKTAQDSHFA